MSTSKRVNLTDVLSFSQTIAGLMRLREWQLSPEDLVGWIEQCLEMGVTTFDHADIYGSYTCEAEFGRALALKPSLRDQMQIVTKCGIMLVSPQRPEHDMHRYETTYDYICKCAEHSLRNLQTDRLDVLLIHRPDPLMNADVVATAFNELRKEGKVLNFGVSNFSPSQFELLQSRVGFPLVTNQVEASVLHLAPIYDGTFDQAQRLRRPPMIWSPLAGGRIFGDGDERQGRVRDTLNAIADELGAGVDQVALRWLLMLPGRLLNVLGTGKLERIKAAVDAETLPMTRSQWFRILIASQGHDVP